MAGRGSAKKAATGVTAGSAPISSIAVGKLVARRFDLPGGEEFVVRCQRTLFPSCDACPLLFLR
jgi:hypothetical protein